MTQSVVFRPVFATKQLQGKICLTPFNSIHINVNGAVNVCLCPGWQPITVGNILHQTLDEILGSAHAVAIRKSIIDGTYTFCNENRCAILINNQLNDTNNVPLAIRYQLDAPERYVMPTTVAFNVDSTCNLSCPSCRTKVIKPSDAELDKRVEISNRVFDNLFKPTDQPLELIVSGAGELFASPMIMQVLERLNLDQFPNLALNIHTNGLLAPARWNKIEHLESAIKILTVSVDASSAITYEKIRRGGAWSQLLESMEFLHKKSEQLKFPLRARMIVQVGNFQEAEHFYKFCQQYNVSRVEYSRIIDWGTWSPGQFQHHDVLNVNHLSRPQAVEIFGRIKKLPNVWFEGNFD